MRPRRTGPDDAEHARCQRRRGSPSIRCRCLPRSPCTNLNVAPACKRGNSECTTVTPNCPSLRDCDGYSNPSFLSACSGHHCRAERIYVSDTQAVIARAQRGVPDRDAPRLLAGRRVGAGEGGPHRHIDEGAGRRARPGSTRWRSCRWPPPQRRPPMPSARAPTDSTACAHARGAPSAVTRTTHEVCTGARLIARSGQAERRRQQCIAVRSRSAAGPAVPVQPRARSGTEQCPRPSQQAR